MNSTKKKPKAGVPLKEAQALGYAQVVGMPGVAYAKGGKLFGATLVEVDERGERVEPVEKPDVIGEYTPDPLPAAAQVEPTGNPLQARIDEAQAELDAWVAANDTTTDEGKREYARLYGRVRRAKDALKAGV